MRDVELHHPELDHPSGPGRSVQIVVVGHAGLATVQTPDKRRTSPGGSGYAVASSAAALIGSRVGLVAQVGRDFDLAPLRHLGVNLDGVLELPGRSARLRIDEFLDGSRCFSCELGVAATVRLESFPSAYLDATYVHLGTAPPEQQLTWLRFLHDRGCTAQISADMFEHYVANDPETSREVCDNANLILMNEAEYDGLYGDGHGPVPKAPLILKRGSAGASLLADGLTHDVRAAEAHVVDPTGGGEILAGVFLALRADGLSQIPALEYAVRAAASCVEEFGVRGSRLIAALADIRSEVLGKRSASGDSYRKQGQ
jgi:sugar/nucleoside kinase (ribokinase family)